MKFLCVPCDEPMKLQEAVGPDRGSMSIVYHCMICGHAVAMLTNQMETQMVRSLGVKIGGRSEEPAPMEMLHSKLSTEAPSQSSGSKCPFTGVVAAAYERSAGPRWSERAERRIQAVPSFVRQSVRKQVEEKAQQLGYAEITEEVMDMVRKELGM